MHHPSSFTRRRLLTAGAALAAALTPIGRALAKEGGAVDGGALLKPGSPDDQSAALMQALAQARAQGKPLYLPEGIYRVAKVALPSGARILGAGPGTRLVHARPGPMVVAENGADMLLADMTLDGDHRQLGEGEALLNGNNATIELRNCGFLDSGGHGVVLEACGGRVVNCVIEGARFSGLFARNSTGLSVEGNVLRECANNGILIWRSQNGDDGSIVRGNRIEDIRADGGGSGQNGNGVNVFRAGGVIVSDNVMRNCAFTAVRANATENVQIIGNSIRKMGEVAIFVEFGFSGAVVSGNMIDRAATGISMTNFNEGGRLAACSGNLVRDLFRRPDPESGVETYGVGIAAEADAAVTGNVIEGAAFAGLMLGYGPYLRDVTASGNLIRESAYGVAVSVAPGAGAAVIRGNTIAKAEKGAIVGHAWDKAVTADLAREGARAYGNLTIEGNVVQ